MNKMSSPVFHREENAFESRFGLQPIPPSKIAEISKATAESGCPPEARINLHIGNPVQDARLDQFYAQLVLDDPLSRFQESEWPDCQEHYLQSLKNPLRQKIIRLIFESIVKANPYMPRGGFNPKKPGTLIQQIQNWLTRGQDEPLDYDLGQSGNKPEIAITSGGKNETLKLLLQVIEENLKGPFKNIIALETTLAAGVTRAYLGKIFCVEGVETELLQKVKNQVRQPAAQIGFILFSKIYSKDFRRKLAALAAEENLMLLEANDAPNAYSLARSPGMAERLLRIVTPQAIDPRLTQSALTFVLGNAKYIDALNLMHFLKKGTPSATEVKLLSFLLTETGNLDQKLWKHLCGPKKSTPNPGGINAPATNLDNHYHTGLVKLPVYEKTIDNLLTRVESVVSTLTSRLDRINHQTVTRLEKLTRIIQKDKYIDSFAGKSPWEIIQLFFQELENPAFPEQLQQAFLAQFSKIHPEFEADFMLPLSGSARTALSLLAEASHLTEAVVPDLSWTFGDAFQKIIAIPLTEDLSFSAENIKQTILAQLERHPHWANYGCVILNNPHNATGKITPEKEIEQILRFCLSRQIRVIDDLSYSNVLVAAPHQRQPIGALKNCRQITHELIQRGELPPTALRFLITIRSISKTDCKAGARLSVLEIPDKALHARVEAVTATMEPNRLALLLAYLFYRNPADKIYQFWALRDQIQWERMQALVAGLNEIPPADNVYGIQLVAPQGAMYPHLVVTNLPECVSIDDLSTRLAARGIGMVPLTTFAHTAASYTYATRSFRLTLGGSTTPRQLKRQIVRLVAELNTEIQRYAYDYTLYSRTNKPDFIAPATEPLITAYVNRCEGQFIHYWNQIEKLATTAGPSRRNQLKHPNFMLRSEQDNFILKYLEQRKQAFLLKLREQARLVGSLNLNLNNRALQQKIIEKFQEEIRYPTEAERRAQFQQRLFDRTVHPTQSYSIQVEKALAQLIHHILNEAPTLQPRPEDFFRLLHQEYLAENIAIKSSQEAEEAILDLDLLSLVEDYADYFYQTKLDLTLALWGDWDGSRRPSGQGHTLVAGALITNVLRLTDLVRSLDKMGLLNRLDHEVLNEIGNVEQQIKKFLKILKNITALTTQLEARYRKHLESTDRPNWLIRSLRKIGLARDPVQIMWKHNDRNERRMQSYRRQRSTEILHFFRVNHQLQTMVQRHLPEIINASQQPELLKQLATYKNPLKRFYLTPRIHQKIITARDSFAIDTTVYNLVEINRMGAQYGYPGLVLSLQVSMTNQAEAIITIDKKLRREWERILREDAAITPVSIRVVPLFEEIEILQEIESFLDQIWEYADESKALGQSASARFCEIIGEFFIAGSDLSQQVSQPQALVLFKQAKSRINTYLLKKGLAGKLRIKFGSGEPAQRQGGYYDPFATHKVIQLPDSPAIVHQLKVDGFTAAALSSARSPLNGIFSSSDFRTFQSNIMEKLRFTSVHELVNLFYHLRTVQAQYRQKIEQVNTTYWGSRRRLQEEMLSQLDLLMKGQLSPAYLEFTELVQKNFKQILYGNLEDMAGIHVVSYFISRALMSVRDRPTVRPTKETGEDRGRQIVEQLSGTLPLSEHGTLLRAIGHNKAQTMILGINQLTTGLFRSLREFIGDGKNVDEQLFKLRKEILPHLPVKDILNSVRLYHEPDLIYLKRLENAFPPGNSALKMLIEEQRTLNEMIPYLQEELLRRNGLAILLKYRQGNGNLPAAAFRIIRPDLAVLLQPDLFNVDVHTLFPEAAPEKNELVALEQELLRRKWIGDIQEEIWQFLEKPITEQVKSFFELAQAIKALRTEGKIAWPRTSIVSRGQIIRLGAEVNRMLRNVTDDSMRQFLIAAVQYLLYLPETLEDIPEAVLIALRDVKKILSLDEQALSPQDQKYLHFLFVKIARIGGDSG